MWGIYYFAIGDDRCRLKLRNNLVLRILLVALFADVHTPAEQSEHRTERLAADTDGKHEPRHLVVVVVQTRTRTAVAVLFP